MKIRTKKHTRDEIELMGTYEVANFLGIKAQNLSGKSVPKDLPEPIGGLRATRVWLGDEIRAFAVEHGYPRDHVAA